MGVARKYTDKVAGFCPCCLGPLGQIILIIELVHGRFVGAVFITFYVDHPFGSHLWAFYPVDEAIYFLAGIRSGTWNGNPNYQFGRVEYIKIFVLRYWVEFAKLHSKTNVRFVVTV